MHSEKVSWFNPLCLFGVDRNAKRPTDYERAARLAWDTQLAIENDMLHLRDSSPMLWIAHLEELGNDEERFCRNSHISLEMLNWITVMDAPELLENLFGLLQVKDVTPLPLSQQYAAQEHLPDKVFYVLGGRRCRLFFRVEATISLCKRTG